MTTNPDDALFEVLAKLADHYGWELSKHDPGPYEEGCEYTWKDAMHSHLCQLELGHEGCHEDRACWEYDSGSTITLADWAKAAGVVSPDSEMGMVGTTPERIREVLETERVGSVDDRG